MLKILYKEVIFFKFIIILIFFVNIDKLFIWEFFRFIKYISNYVELFLYKKLLIIINYMKLIFFKYGMSMF